jgi:hypothetical protein
VDQFILFFVVAAVVAVIWILNHHLKQQRSNDLAALAKRRGLHFSKEEDYSLPGQYAFLDVLNEGRNRYAFNILQGTLLGRPFQAFDYHYTTGSGKSRKDHYYTFMILALPLSFPELTIAPEGIFSKLAQTLGYDDIDFESAEFSSAFCVRSTNKKFAYDFCNPQMMEYLIAHKDLSLELERNALILGFERQLSPEEIERNLERLGHIYSRIPKYVLAPQL